MLLLAAKQTGSTTWSYDSNGHATAIHDVNGTDRTMQVDRAGHILRMSQGDQTSYTLMVNDELIGSTGKEAKDDTIGRAWQSAMSLSAGQASSSYILQKGDSFAGIAKAVWGDSSLWYLIADANALSNDDSLKAGQALMIPSRTTGLHNNTGTNKVYNPNDILGDTSQTLTHPAADDEGCGVVGQVIMVAVAVAVTLYTAGAGTPGVNGLFAVMEAGATALGGSLGFAGAFMAGAAGSVASQVVGMAMGNVKEFDWKSVAMSGISAGAGSWVGDLARAGTLPAVFQTSATARAMLSSGVSQGIGIVTRQQNGFSWRNIAIAGASAFVGERVGSFLKEQNLLNLGNGYEYLTNVARATVSGFASGVTASVLRAGRVDVQQVAADAFGNALGSSLVEKSSGVMPKAKEVNDASALEIDPANPQNSTQASPSISTSISAALVGKAGKLTITRDATTDNLQFELISRARKTQYSSTLEKMA